MSIDYQFYHLIKYHWVGRMGIQIEITDAVPVWHNEATIKRSGKIWPPELKLLSMNNLFHSPLKWNGSFFYVKRSLFHISRLLDENKYIM